MKFDLLDYVLWINVAAFLFASLATAGEGEPESAWTYYMLFLMLASLGWMRLYLGEQTRGRRERAESVRILAEVLTREATAAPDLQIRAFVDREPAETPEVPLVGPVVVTEKARCPVCQALLLDGTGLVFCAHCLLPHHRDCVKENAEKCAAFGCGKSIAPPTPPEPERVVLAGVCACPQCEGCGECRCCCTCHGDDDPYENAAGGVF